MKKSTKIISVIMSVIMLLPVFTGCSNNRKTDDGKDMKDKEEYYLTLSETESEKTAVLDFESPNFAKNNSALYDSYVTDAMSYEGEGKTFHWKATKNIFFYSPEITDWSGYDTLKVAIYSGKKTNGTIQMKFMNPKEPDTGITPYFRYPMVVNWTGWKVFVIDITSLGGNYDKTWDNIVNISFDMSGWNLDPKTGNDLYFSTLWLFNKEYKMNVPDGVSLDDSEIYDQVKDQWREYSLGNPNGYKNQSKQITDKIKTVSANCKSSWDNFKKTYKKAVRDTAFNLTIVQGKSGDESKINTLYNNILNMTKGYGTVGSDYYHNKSLLEDIKSVLEYSYRFYYGQNVIEKGTYGNWWYWDIGIPLVLTEILIDLENELDYQTIVKYLSPFDHLCYYPSMTACNKLWVTKSIFASAFLQEDAERILISKAMMNDIFDYVTYSDGFYTDGSFIQHDAFPYTGGYGASMFGQLTVLMLIMRGSRFDFIEENVSNQYKWAFDSFQPIMYGTNLMASMRGREVDRNTSETSAFYSSVCNLITMTTYAPEDVLPKLESLIRYYMKNAKNDFSSNVPLMLTDYAVSLYNNEEVAPRSNYDIVKVFGNMDRIVQHGEKYGVCVALNSTRIYKYESLNNENKSGWYQSEGMIYIYTDGFDYGYNFFHYVNTYRLPGTTVPTMTRSVDKYATCYGSSPFVGGVEAGKYGLAVFALGYPASNLDSVSISGNKSYFMFDNEIVCIGSEISDSSGSEVITVVENRNIRNGDTFIVDGNETKLITDKKTTVNANYMHFTNMGGYVFPSGASITYNKSDKVNTAFLETWLSHGTNPTEGKYSYIYLPEATAGQTAVYQQNPDVQILEQTNDIHVVKETKLGVTGYAFYKAGKSNGVEVSSPCCVMISEENGEKVINISDPTHLLSSFTVTVDVPGVSSVVSADEGASCQIGSEKVTITVNQIDCSGETYTVRVK